MADHGIHMMQLPKILRVGQQLLCVDDATGVGQDSDAALGRSATSDAVHVSGAPPVGFVHVEVQIELEVF